MQVKVEGYNVYYETFGKGNPVVLLHGWLTDLETMRPVANYLSKDFKVYLVDVVGFGKSDMIEKDFHSDDYGDFTKNLLDALDIKDPILIGHSNGGRCILNAAGRKLINPRKIILFDSAGLIPKRPMKYYIKVGIAKVGKKALEVLSFSKSFKEKMYAKVGSSDYKNSNPILRETMKNILNEDIADLLPNISAPTLLFWGVLDTATPIADGRRMKDLIPNAGIVEYPYGTHYAFLENINNVNVVLDEFLKNDK